MDSGWCTIESDPAVFTEMIQRFGVKGVAAEELVSCDEDSVKALGENLYGLVLLFKWKPQPVQRKVEEESTMFFAQQIVPNACATQAIVNILLNQKDRVELGSELSNLLEFTAAMDPRMRGEMIGQSDTLRSVHNSFARPSVFSFEDRQAKEDDDVYHFIGFTYKNGAVWELDGLQKGPIIIQECPEEGWKNVAATAIQSRIQEIIAMDTTGTGQGISFSLMGVVEDKISVLEKQLEKLKSEEKPTGYVESELVAAKEDRARGEQENIRRRHNYFPAVVALLRGLAEKGKLQGAVDAAKARGEAKAAAKRGGKK